MRIKSEGGRKVVALDCSSPHWNQVIFMDGRLSFRGRRIDSGCLHGLFAQWSTVGNLFWLWALLLVILGAKTHLKLNFGDNVKTEFAILTKKCYEKTFICAINWIFKMFQNHYQQSRMSVDPLAQYTDACCCECPTQTSVRLRRLLQCWLVGRKGGGGEWHPNSGYYRLRLRLGVKMAVY